MMERKETCASPAVSWIIGGTPFRVEFSEKPSAGVKDCVRDIMTEARIERILNAAGTCRQA